MKQEISFGTWARNQRRLLDLTRQALANQVGCAEVTLRRIENDTLKPSRELALILLEKLGIPENDRQQWVQFARGLTGHPKQAVDSSPAKPLTNLLLQLSTFIGREKEQAEIIQHINKHRLVTLTGTGGVGKTRLSIKVGEQVLGDYSNGVWLLELASLKDPTLLPQTVATQLGLVTQSNDPLSEILVNFLRTKTILLIFDNCEHLLNACSQLADTLLKNCPNVKILATSRETLGIMGELLYRVPSLGLPDMEGAFENIREYAAMRLFEERAQLAQSDFKLTKENAASVAQICSRLDGIPLAIELAAAHMVIFSTDQLAARLNKSFDLLTGRSVTALPRQQTIRASIDWSWTLTSNPERTLLRRISVFSGGWTLEAAESICSGDGIESTQVLGLMSQLVAQSLVNVNQASGREKRFHVHEAIRQYAHEKLVEAGESENIRSLHLKYYLKLSELDDPALHGIQQMEWFGLINVERGNIRVALEHALQTDLEAGLYLAGRLIRYWENYDLREGLTWTTEFVQKQESKNYPRARAIALLTQGDILWYLQQFDAGRSIAKECLALFRACGDQQGEYEGLMLMGAVLQFQEGMEEKVQVQKQALDLAISIGDTWRRARVLAALGWDQRDPEQAREYWEEAIILFRQLGDWRSLVHTLGILSFTLLSNGDVESAKKFQDEALEANQHTNDKWGMEFVLTGKSHIALMQGNYEQARAFLQKNLDFLKEVGNRMGYLWGYARLGYVALREGNVAEAHHILIEVIGSFHKDKNKNGLAFSLEKMASLYVVLDKPEDAARLIGWSDRTRKALGEPRPRREQIDLDRDIASISAKTGNGTFEKYHKEGMAMTIEEAVALAVKEIRL
jgi:predicted ATPase/DNA-binding XRE family transcriptional regulator